MPLGQAIEFEMKKVNYIAFLLIGMFMSCSTTKINFSQLGLAELEKKGYTIFLDSVPINLSYTYLNDNNILLVNQDRSNKTVKIIRKNKNAGLISFDELLAQKSYSTKIDHLVVNNSSIDSLEISKIKFESGSIKYIRLLTQKDYEGNEYDDLPQVKQAVGNGMLIINTISASANNR
jgi:hypothetical protein